MSYSLPSRPSHPYIASGCHMVTRSPIRALPFNMKHDITCSRMWAAWTLHKYTRIQVKWLWFKYFDVIQSIGQFVFTQTCSPTARQPLHEAESRLFGFLLTRSALLLGYFLTCTEFLSLSRAAGAAEWTAPGYSSVLCFLLGGGYFFSPSNLLSSLLHLYLSSGSFCTTVLHKDILWCHSSLSRNKNIQTLLSVGSFQTE